MEDVLKSGYYESRLGYNFVDWFVDDVSNLGNEMAFYFKNTKKDIIMTEEDKEDFNYNTNCRFCEKEFLIDEVGDPCHLTGKGRDPAHNECNNNVTQDQSIFLPFISLIINNYDCHLFFKKLVDKKNDRVKYKIIPKTKEEYISVLYGCIGFFDRYRFLSSSLDKLVKTLVGNSNKTSKNSKDEIVDNVEILKVVNEIGDDKRKLLKI